jgi:hypothetical protein
MSSSHTHIPRQRPPRLHRPPQLPVTRPKLKIQPRPFRHRLMLIRSRLPRRPMPRTRRRLQRPEIPLERPHLQRPRTLRTLRVHRPTPAATMPPRHPTQRQPPPRHLRMPRLHKRPSLRRKPHPYHLPKSRETTKIPVEEAQTGALIRLLLAYPSCRVVRFVLRCCVRHPPLARGCSASVLVIGRLCRGQPAAIAAGVEHIQRSRQARGSLNH